MLTMQEYLEKVSERYRIEWDHWRLGQAYYNVLWEEVPNLADSISNTSVDPFYDDGNIASFLSYLAQELP